MQLVEALAHAHGLLDLPRTDDAVLLGTRLAGAIGQDIVLTAAEERTYQRMTVRMNTIWALANPLDHFLY